MRDRVVQFKLNLPVSVADWIEEEARKNLRSKSSEIVLALKEKMDRFETKKADAPA